MNNLEDQKVVEELVNESDSIDSSSTKPITQTRNRVKSTTTSRKNKSVARKGLNKPKSVHSNRGYSKVRSKTRNGAVSNLTLDEAIYKVLKQANKPLPLKDIATRLVKSGLYSFKTTNPIRSVSTCLNRHIKKYGNDSLFVNNQRGVFSIHSTRTNSKTIRVKKSHRKSSNQAKLTKTAIIKEVLNTANKPLTAAMILVKIKRTKYATEFTNNSASSVTRLIQLDLKKSKKNSDFLGVANGKFKLQSGKNTKKLTKHQTVRSKSTNPNLMTIKAAIRLVLQQAGKPLHYNEICSRIEQQNLCEFISNDHHKSVLESIYSDLRKKRNQSTFKRIRPGWYQLRINLNSKNKVKTKSVRGNQKLVPTLMDAVFKVLTESAKPLRGMEISKRIVAQNLFHFTTRSPVKSVYSAISRHIKRKGNESLIGKDPLGRFFVRDDHSSSNKTQLIQDRVSINDAITGILKKAHNPLNYREITQRILTTYPNTLRGKTPVSSVYGLLYNDIKSKGNNSKFKRLSSGEFKLRENRQDLPSQVQVNQPSPATGRQKSNHEHQTWLNAIETILAKSPNYQPMHYNSIIAKAIKEGLLAKELVTKQRTLLGILNHDIAKGTAGTVKSRFFRSSPGMFGLTKWNQFAEFKTSKTVTKSRKISKRAYLAKLKKMEPAKLAKRVSKLYELKGMSVVSQSKLNSKGRIEIRGKVAESKSEPYSIVIQIRSKKDKIDNSAIKKFRKSIKSNEVGLIVTTAKLTQQKVTSIKKKWKKKDIHLLDGTKLAKQLIAHGINA